MTNAEPPGRGADRPDSGAGPDLVLLVRSTLAAVAATTDVGVRPRGATTTRLADRVGAPRAADADLGPTPTGAPQAADRLPRTPASGSDHPDRAERSTDALGDRSRPRRWPILAAAAAFIVVLVGLLAVTDDDRTVTTVPAQPGAVSATDPPAPAVTDEPTSVGPPLEAAGASLGWIAVGGWHDGTTDLSTTETARAPRGAVGPLVVPWSPVGRWGVEVTAHYATVRPTQPIVGFPEPFDYVAAPPTRRITISTGITVDVARMGAVAFEALPALDGFVADLGDRCPSDVPVDHWFGPPHAIELSVNSPCRAVMLVWTNDQIVVIDAEPGTPLRTVVDDLRRESFDQFEGRLGGIDGVEELRSMTATIEAFPGTPKDE